MRSHLFLRGLTACWLISASVSAWGQLPQPILNTVFPMGGKAGTSVDVTVGGTDLDEGEQLQFSHPGIKASLKTAPPVGGGPVTKGKGPKRVEGQFTVTIDGNVPPGIYEARLVGRFGVSNSRGFAVSSLNEIVDADGNTNAEKAAAVTVGSVINSKVDANNFRYYRVALKAKERIVIDCFAERIDSRMDATVAVLSPAGKELLRVRDGVGKDAVAEFTAPSEGSYLIRVQDNVYGGGVEFFYRLYIHSLPHIDFIFPPAGPAGSKNSYTIYGRNIPGGKPSDMKVGDTVLEKLDVKIEIPQNPETQVAFDTLPALQRYATPAIAYRLSGPNGASNPVPLYISKAPVIVEKEPNNKADQVQKLTVPTEVAAQFYPQNDTDWYEFDAKKGDSYVIEVISHRMGLSTDPSISIFKLSPKDGKLTDVAQVDDPGERNTKLGTDYDVSTDDPSYKLNVAEDATYRISVRDQFGTGRNDPRMTYRLAIRRQSPDFVLLAQPSPSSGGKTPQQQQQQASMATPIVRKGGTAIIDVALVSQDDFSGEVTISVEGLPAGLKAPSLIASGNVNALPLVITAEEGAASWSGPVKIVGKATIDGKEVVHEARYAIMVWGSANRQQQTPKFRFSQNMQVSVMDKEMEPVTVAIEDKMWEMSVGGNLEVPLSITRRGDFKDALKLTAVGLPQDIKPKEVTADANATAAKLEIPLTAANIKPGIYTFILRGDAKRKYVRNPDAVTNAEAEQKELVETIAKLTAAQKEATANKDQATKAATETAAKVKEAEAAKKNAKDDEVAAADKALAEAQAAATTATEAKTRAEATLKDLTTQLTQATQMKTAVDAKITAAKTANQAKDITQSVNSMPVKMRVVSSPFSLKADNPQVTVKQGEKVELPITLNRLFGFAEAVDLTFEPSGVAGLTAGKISIAKDKNDGKFEVTTTAKTAPGEYQVPVKAKGKFNGVNVEASTTVTVKVEAAG